MGQVCLGASGQGVHAHNHYNSSMGAHSALAGALSSPPTTLESHTKYSTGQQNVIFTMDRGGTQQAVCKVDNGGAWFATMLGTGQARCKVDAHSRVLLAQDLVNHAFTPPAGDVAATYIRKWHHTQRHTIVSQLSVRVCGSHLWSVARHLCAERPNHGCASMLKCACWLNLHRAL